MPNERRRRDAADAGEAKNVRDPAPRRAARRTPAARAAQTMTSVPGDAESGTGALDRVIHERMRLGIVSALAVNESLSFNDLKQLMGTTDGNLSVHARKLEDAGYLQCTKSFEGRVPRTEFRLTAPGRRALAGYLDHMEALIRATRGGSGTSTGT
jgi:DNA-binding transcriptional ArsR family regulator